MEVCGEHGYSINDEIAHRAGNCPACAQLEEKEQEWEAKREELMSQLEDYVAQLDAKDQEIEDLHNELREERK